jgi:branched-chain amino acid transport system permease protein
VCATAVGVLFGIPSLRIKGLYLAVATLAAQFFVDWAFLRIKWFTNDSSSGSVSVADLKRVRPAHRHPVGKYLFCLGFLVVFALLAKNLVRGHIGREWMAIRDMDVAAAVIGIRPVYAKLTAFAVSSFIVGVAGALWGFVHLGSWEPAAFNIDRSFHLLFMVIIGGLGSIMGSFFGAAFIVVLPILLDNLPAGLADRHGSHALARAPDLHDLRRADRLLPDRRTARPGPAVVDRQGKAAPVALPALSRCQAPRAAPHHRRAFHPHPWRQT